MLHNYQLIMLSNAGMTMVVVFWSGMTWQFVMIFAEFRVALVNNSNKRDEEKLVPIAVEQYNWYISVIVAYYPLKSKLMKWKK